MICVKCQIEKPASAFYVRGSGRPRRPRRECKTCHRAAAKVREQADPAKHAARIYAYRQRNLAAERARNKAYRARRPEVGFRAYLKYTYGLALEDYQSMLEAQDERCAICGGQDEDSRLHVDHCHTTGKVRGLLCESCNLSIGRMGDSPSRLRSAAAYLEAR